MNVYLKKQFLLYMRTKKITLMVTTLLMISIVGEIYFKQCKFLKILFGQ